jgi:hypothetical protein
MQTACKPACGPTIIANGIMAMKSMRSEERPVLQPSEDGLSKVNDRFARWFIPGNPRLHQ